MPELAARRLIGYVIGSAFSLMLSVGPALAQAPATTQTIVFVRHSEKPEAGLGQLNCQGLNRALALPAVIRRNFGKPDAIFAPDPSETKMDGGKPYDYVRPLATIEPTAIVFGLPIDASIGVSKTADLQKRLQDPAYNAAFVLVAWEHNELVVVARALVSAAGGNPKAVPNWKGSDFDGMYVLKITRAGAASTVVFERRVEGLDGGPKSCPGEAKTE